MSIKPADDEAVPIIEADLSAKPEPTDDDALPADEVLDDEVSDAVRIEFASAFERVKKKPLGVNVVVLKGLKRTRHYIVARELQHLPQASNLDELKDALLEVWAALLRLQIFDAVDVVMDEGRQLPARSALISCLVFLLFLLRIARCKPVQPQECRHLNKNFGFRNAHQDSPGRRQATRHLIWTCRALKYRCSHT